MLEHNCIYVSLPFRETAILVSIVAKPFYALTGCTPQLFDSTGVHKLDNCSTSPDFFKFGEHSHYVAQIGTQLVVFLPQLSK